MPSVPLRILQVIPAIAPRYGGPSTMVIGLARSLERAGHRVEIVTSDADGEAELPIQIGTLNRYKNAWVRFFPRRYGEAFKYAAGMRAWLDQNVAQFDVVHIHAVFSWSSLAAARACRKAGVPYIVRPLGSLDPWSLDQRALLKKLLRKLDINRMLRGADFIHYTTRLEQQAAERVAGFGEGIVIPNAVQLPDGTDQPPAVIDGRYFLFLGRLSPKKKLEQIIAGFDCADLDPAVRLVIAGDGDPGYREALARQIAESSCADRVVMHGWANAAERDALNRHALASVLVSHNENYGISIVEAMAWGTPAIVDQGVYLSETIEEVGAGWVLEADAEPVAGLARLMESIASDEAGRVACGEAARTLVKNRYTWSVVAEQTAALYEKLGRSSREQRDALHSDNCVSVMIFTLNEAINLPHCLASLDWCDDVIVIDSGSSDSTKAIAQAAGARVFEHSFEGFGTQRNWAIDNTGPRHGWLLMLDADERVPFDLADEINRIAKANPQAEQIAAARVARRFHLWGRWLRYSSLYPVWVVRLVHRERVRYLNRGHAETQRVDGNTVALSHDLIDENHKDMQAWRERQTRYARADAAYELNQKSEHKFPGALVSSDPMVRKAALKSFGARLPGRQWWYLGYGLIARQGIRDGWAGIRFTRMRAEYQRNVAREKKRLIAAKHDR